MVIQEKKNEQSSILIGKNLGSNIWKMRDLDGSKMSQRFQVAKHDNTD